jgi:hypothetical protein
MTAREFYDKVVDMRRCQQEYKRKRTEDAMLDMLEAEEVVDKEIARVSKIIGR